MKTRNVVAFAVTALLAVAAPAAAQAPLAGAWSLTFDVGVDSSYEGELYNRSEGTLAAMPVQVSAREYSNAYGPGLNWSVGVGRGLTDRWELRIRAAGSILSGSRKQTGRVGTANNAGTLFSNPDDYSEVGVDVGLRRYFLDTKIQPYVGGAVGFARVSAIGASFDVPDATFTFAQDLDLYGDSTAGTFSAGGGMLINTSDRFGIYVNAEIRFRSGLKENDTDLVGTGFEPLNNESTRWNLPLSVGGRVRF
jgi:hypothetical protein